MDPLPILVTGGAGYIGSHTCKILSENGFLPITFDNLSLGHRWAVQWGPLITGDIADAHSLRAVIEHYQPVAVIHFAAFSLVGESVQWPAKYYANNSFGALNLLEVLRQTNVKNIVFSSTCSVYGITHFHFIDEQHPINPINPYAQSKRFVELMLSDFERSAGLKSVILRYFNAAGADADGHTGELHDPETHLIPLAIEATLQKHPPLKIFGEDYPTSDGTPIRDYIHVTDLAHAHVCALRYLLDGGASDVFNVGTGAGYSVKQVIDVIEKTSGRPVPRELAERRAGDAPELVADATKIRQTLHWQPRHSQLENIVETAWQWHAKFIHLRQRELLPHRDSENSR